MYLYVSHFLTEEARRNRSVRWIAFSCYCAIVGQVACDRLRREFGVAVQTGQAYVAYREGISAETEM